MFTVITVNRQHNTFHRSRMITLCSSAAPSLPLCAWCPAEFCRGTRSHRAAAGALWAAPRAMSDAFNASHGSSQSDRESRSEGEPEVLEDRHVLWCFRAGWCFDARR